MNRKINKTPTDIKFTIEMLQRDKIIYALEAIAINTLALSFFAFASGMRSWLVFFLTIGVFGLANIYMIYMGVSNFLRLRKIKQLQTKL
jgi:uncharacterized membrane protein